MDDKNYHGVPLIGESAPEFTAVGTSGKINFPKDYKGKWVIFFSHPADFTPVCTTELMILASMHDEFRKMNCELVGLSVDSTFSHIGWLKSIKDNIEYKGLKDLKIEFPVIADLSMEVSKLYGMIHPGESKVNTVRAVFIIDPEGKIRAIFYYPGIVGRNMDEIKRTLIALQTFEKHNVAFPANWQPGEDVLVRPTANYEKVLARVDTAGEDFYCLDWYLCFQKCPEDSDKQV